MRQPEPCCGGLVTPTVDELLAVARNKPLPRMKVRERRPPPAKVGASLKGWLEWRLINRQGREVRGGEGPNLILDQGLDQIATTELLAQRDTLPAPASFFPIIRYAAVGTGSGAPDASDTGLESELARTDATFATETLTRPAPGVYRLTRFIEFDYAVANGVLAEWGFSGSSADGSNLFNRALFTDSGGSPDAITKTDQEKLRLTYILEIALSPVAFTAGSFTVTGVGTVNGDYTLIGGNAPSGDILEQGKGPDLVLFSALARGSLGIVFGTPQRPLTGAAMLSANDQSGLSYASVVNYNTDAALLGAAREVVARDAYTPGSFTRTGGAWRWDTAYGNHDPIKAAFIQGASEQTFAGQDIGRPGYVFNFDASDEFSKDDEHTLTIGVPTVSWGRAS